MSLLDARLAKSAEGGPSFSLGNRLFRIVWTFAWLVLARFTPPPLHGWRRLVLIAFGAKIGARARIHASVAIWHPRNLAIGADTLIGPGVRLYNQGRITIGARAVVSQRAHLCASSHDVRDPHFQLVTRPIILADHCWIAAEAFVGPGVHVGKGAVLAARGALFTPALADTIYRGNPAVAIRPRGTSSNEVNIG
ncbi:putative colanic acid biosynthesis acetyltransferase [Croceicoccus sp. F390]|uniref:Colanic acid biosynthesis acetyltransferase n=1 Tax=Croceicoccus esteveae TaxID=3075597 RepID=A0ABU2ZK05_9SPHN|nr:putative colanic acid biosynthesis acetyltransferase [Croceicoccus sp. F390]MDT0575732.1 putative colanic acid biosynthesis acetyltransferase [Croceicoccus sp. F390]